MSDRKIARQEFVALDLEATGIAFGHDRIIEVGAVRFRVDESGTVSLGPRLTTLIDPGMPVPEVVARLTGLDSAALVGAPPLAEVWAQLAAFVDGAVVLAHHAQADLAWLASEALRLGLPPLEVPFFCTLQLARRCVPGAPRYALDALVAHLGLTSGGHHRALADAVHTRNLFARCVALSAASDLKSLGLVRPEPWPTEAQFRVQIPARLRELEDFIAAQRPVSLCYRGGSRGPGWRPATPLGFFAHASVPYLRIWCHLADDARSLRCDRISRWEPG